MSSNTRVKSLSRGLIFRLLAVVGLASFGGSIVLTLYIAMIEWRNLETRADHAIQQLAYELEKPLWNLDMDAIKSLGESLCRDPQYNGFTCVDEHSEELYSCQSARGGKSILRQAPVLHNEQEIGRASLYISTDFYHRTIWRVVQTAIVVNTVLLGTLLAVAGFIIRTQMSKPLDALSGLVRAYQENRIPPSAGNRVVYQEFQVFESVLRTMWEHVEMTRLRLEEAIVSRTQELEDHKRTEEALRQSEERFTLSMEATSDGLWDWHVSTDDGYFSPSYYRMLGYEQDAFAPCGAEWMKLIHPDDIETALRANNDCIEGRRDTFEAEYRMKANNGEWRWILGRGKCVQRDENGRAIRMLGTHVDITERKTREREIQRIEQVYRDAITAAGGIPYAHSYAPVETYSFLDSRIADLLGYPIETITPQFLTSITIDDIYVGEIAGLTADEAFLRAREGKLSTWLSEFSVRARSGKLLWLLDAAIEMIGSDGRPKGSVGMLQDITARKEAERALAAQSARYQRLLDTASDGIHVLSMDGTLVEASSSFYSMLGYTRDDAPPRHVADWDAQWSVTELQQMILEFTNSPAVFETRHRRRDGRIIDVEISARHIEIDGQKYLYAASRDISERRRNEERLRILSKAVEQSPASIVITTPEGNIEYVNPKFTQVTGYTLEEVHGQNPRVLKSGESSSESYRILWACITAGFEWRGEFRNKRKNGEIYTELAIISPIRDAAGKTTHYLAVKEDITEMKSAAEEKAKLEEQLRQSQKMESVGRLAGGVAHDFNNMLTVILGHAELILSELGPTHHLAPDLVEIRSAARRSSDLTRQLLAFARKQTILPTLLNLNESIESMIKMLQRLLQEDIELRWLPARDLWLIKADQAQIDQIMANLCVNARDAITGSGTITIRTENHTFPADIDAPEGILPGDYVRLTVSDTGCGMDQETLVHIFEPFFTTKGIGNGTGLGLAMVYGSVKQNNGFITTDSEPGRGTTFTIYLPRCADAIREEPVERDDSAGLRGGEVVLLVEDEPAILKLTSTFLEKLGYTVIAASSPLEALSLAGRVKSPIDLLMTDVVMPQMSGRELASRLLSRDPKLKCLYLSGYTADVIEHHGVLEEGAHFLQKPFSLENLAAKIRETLLD